MGRGRGLARDLVTYLVPNTPRAPPPGIGNLVTSGLPYMVNIAIISINENIQGTIEHTVAHGMYYWGMLCLRGTISSFIP